MCTVSLSTSVFVPRSHMCGVCQHHWPLCGCKRSSGWWFDVFSASFSFWSWITLGVSIVHMVTIYKLLRKWNLEGVICQRSFGQIVVFNVTKRISLQVKITSSISFVCDYCSYCLWRNYLKLKTSLRGWLNTTPMRASIAWPTVELEKYTWKKTG